MLCSPSHLLFHLTVMKLPVIDKLYPILQMKTGALLGPSDSLRTALDRRTVQSISGLWCSHSLAFSAWPPPNIDRCPSGSPLHSWSSSPCLKRLMIAFSCGSPFLAYSILLLVLPGSEGAGWGMSVSGDCSFPRRMLSGRRNRHE